MNHAKYRISPTTELIPKRFCLGIGSKSQRSESATGFVFQSSGFGFILAGKRLGKKEIA